MRIACITTSYPAYEGDPSGHFVAASVRELEAAGHTVRVIAPPLSPASPFGWPGVAARIRERPLRAFAAATWLHSARRELSQLGQLDRIVAHWALPSAFPIVQTVAPLREVPLVVVSHGGDVRLLLALPARVRARVVRSLAHRATEWHFASPQLLGDLQRTLPHDARHAVAAVANVVAPTLSLPDVRDAQLKAKTAMAGGPYSVVVGRLVPTKRVDLALRFARATAPSEPVVVVGDGPCEPRLRELARELDLDVRFAGRLERGAALGYLGASRRLLFASEAEGLSTVVREAEALGVEVAYVNG